MTPKLRLAAAIAASLLVASCASRPVTDSAPRGGAGAAPALPADPVPRPEPRASAGNGPIYRVFGKPYRVMETSYGYRERGVASWYGSKFHGRLTSSREPYDMHQLTAAHKTLPLPTYVEVRNLKNNRTVIVRVNDRGPFVDNRIIDLSYAAARRLGMVNDGTSLVEVTAISFDEPPATLATVNDGGAAPVKASGSTNSNENKVFVQVGAFGDVANAERRFDLLTANGIAGAFVHRDADREPALYRVRIGPISDVDHYDSVVAELERLGISDSHLVTE